MNNTLRRWHFFINKGMWDVKRENVNLISYILISIFRNTVLSTRLYLKERMASFASALTYSTLLAIVPILAVVFAIARGFGVSKYIEVFFSGILSNQPQVAETIIGFVNSYLVHTKSGIFLGVGLLLMLFTVLMLTSNIERTFNYIWKVKHQRTLFRTITDYLTMFFLIPVVIVVTSGISVAMVTFAKDIDDYFMVSTFIDIFIMILPYFIMSMVFTGLYIFMPNTRVRFVAALIPGIIAGVSMQVLQLLYIHSQVFISSYNAIYGSFAALPLFMLWMQISWNICLYGATLSYTIQNVKTIDVLGKEGDLSYKYRIALSALILSKICRRFELGNNAYTSMELKTETGIPLHIVEQLVAEMKKIGLISFIYNDKDDENMELQPALSIRNITLGMLIDRLDTSGYWTLDLDIRDLFNNEEWLKVHAIRNEYINKMRDIKLKDL